MKGNDGATVRQLPRLLLIGLARINASDSSGNGLLMRGLLAGWPRQELAQIYSSADNGDAGIAEHEFKLGADERVCGRLFIRGKREVEGLAQGTVIGRGGRRSVNVRRQIAQVGSRYLAESGWYELLFPVRLSRALGEWLDRFRPDVILAQGYSLGAVRLALLAKNHTGARLACFWSDDWPAYTYSASGGVPLGRHPHRILVRETAQLVQAADVRFAFGPLMAREYERRYRRPFLVINHSDDPLRFVQAAPVRHHGTDTLSLLVAGTIDRFRAQSILDLDAACGLLQQAGVHARVCLIGSFGTPEIERSIRDARYVDIFPAAGHAELPMHLKGADILVIAEAFDSEMAESYRLSISSKAHLFMFSRRPILVYAPAVTGLARYAAEAGWAEVVTEPDPARLAVSIKALLAAPERQRELIECAWRVGEANHGTAGNGALFVGGLVGRQPNAVEPVLADGAR